MEKIKQLWDKIPDKVKRVIHTFYQTFLAVLLAGLTPIVTLVSTHQLNDAKMALYALVVASIAAAFSAVKGLIVSYLQA